MIIWTTSWPKALSNEMPTGICVMNGSVIIMTSSIAQDAIREWLFSPISASPLSGIYASLRQAQIIILEILKCMDACPAVFKRGGYNFRLS
jgi:hypothetical protein